MPDNIARKRLKQKMLERWENEGGKIETKPKGRSEKNSTRDHEKEAARLSRSSKNSARKSVTPTGNRKSP